MDIDKGLYTYEGQKSHRQCMSDDEGRKRQDYYVPFLFQIGCLIGTVVSNGLQFAAQSKTLFELGISESSVAAGFPTGYTFVSADTNVEKDGEVAPTGQVFLARSAGVIALKPFIDNSGSESYPEWLDEYRNAAMEAVQAGAHVEVHPTGGNGGHFSLGALMMNPSMRGIDAQDLPRILSATPGLPVPLDGELPLTNEDTIVKMVIERAKTIPARATPAAATAYFPFAVCFEGRAIPKSSLKA